MGFSLALLGPFQVYRESDHPDRPNVLDPVSFPTERSRQLLAYLAGNPATDHQRESLATLFWPDNEREAARSNLRTELSRLRTALGDDEAPTPILTATRNTIAANFAPNTVDLQRFDSLLEAIRRHPHDRAELCVACVARMQEAVQLYRGPFLDDIVSFRSPAFDEWIFTNRTRYQERVVQLLATIHGYFERQGDLAQAQEVALQQILVQPWNEEAHRSLMRIYLGQGQRTAALAQYARCQRALAEEMDAKPSAETTALYEHIRMQILPRPKNGAEVPYVGLRAFTPADAGYFFGRAGTVQRLYKAVHALPLVALIGPSGSGKSSLAQAGLLSSLIQTAKNPTQWTVLNFRPGDAPFRNLTLALAPSLNMQADALVLRLRRGSETLVGLVEKMALSRQAAWRGGDPEPEHRVLLFIDQFEEIFSLCPDPAERQSFLDLLLAPLTNGGDPSSRLTMLLTVRADFMGHLLSHGELADHLQDATIILGPMHREEMHQAIEQPALSQGVMFESGLVDRLLVDVGDAPGSLPLLSFTLSQLWEARQDSWITHNAYTKLGGVTGALTNYANGIYAQLSPHEQERTRHIFLQLVQPGQGTADTRRLATQAEIGSQDWPLVGKLADARLVVTGRNGAGQEVVEVIHEALILEWDLLRQWLEADRAFRTWQQRLRARLHEWQHAQEDLGLLLRGALLVESAEWLGRRTESLSATERAFVAASDARRAAEEEAMAAQRQAALTAAQARAQAEAAAGRRLRQLLTGLAGLLLILMAVTLYAVQQRNEARLQADLALARQLSAQALQAAQTKVDRGLLLSLESLARTQDPADITSLFTGLGLDPLLITFLHGHLNETNHLVFTPDNRELLSVDVNGTVLAWSLQDLRRPGRSLAVTPFAPGTDPAAPVKILTISDDGARVIYRTETGFGLWAVDQASPLPDQAVAQGVKVTAFSEDNSRLLVDDNAEQIWIYDGRTGQLVDGPLVHASASRLCAVNHDGSQIALHGGNEGPEGLLTLWNTTTQQNVAPPQGGHIDDIQACTYSPDGTRLATAGFDGTVRLWDTRTGLQIGAPRTGHQGRVIVVAFSADGARMASGDTSNRILLWNSESGQQEGPPLIGHENWIRGLAFSPDGSRLASSDASGKIALWNMQARHILTGHTARVRSVALSPDEELLVTGSFDRHLVIWDAHTGEKIQDLETEHQNSILQIGFSPDGGTLASLDAGGFTVLWDTKSWTPRIAPLNVHNAVLIGVAFSADSRWMATGDFAGQVVLWDVETSAPLGDPILAHPDGWVLALAFSPDGQRLASGGTDGKIHLWSLPDLARVETPLTGHTNWVTSLLFEPAGRALISGSSDQTIRRWDVATGQPLGQPLEGDGSQIWSLALVEKATGPVLVALGGTGNVLWWDWQSFLPLGPPLRTAIESESMAVNRAGDRIYLATFDSTAQMWRQEWLASGPEWSQRACAIANRSLSQEEWTAFLHETPFRLTCP